MLTAGRLTAVAAVAVAAALTACDPSTAAPPAHPLPATTMPPAPPVDLAALVIAPDGPEKGYTRTKFKHWAIVDSPACDARELALQRQGSNVVKGSECDPVAGRWVSPYDGTPITDPETADVDHLVPLAEAWRSGAASWTAERRAEFANDLTGDQLIVVTAHANRSKGDRDPANWKPPLPSHWCLYASRWVTVKLRWHLTADQAERDQVAAMLATCPR